MAEKIGKYEIRGELGRGGFGQVLLGFDPGMNRTVAIKVLNPTGDPSMVNRFRTEATAAGNLKHHNIVTIHEFGEDRQRYFLVMEYLEGQNLQQLMAARGGRLSVLEVLDILGQVAMGLKYAHDHGVTHRDIKPANIMVLPDGVAKLTDFGIARLSTMGDQRLTQTGYLIGTVQYMAPELFASHDSDSQTDIWALGVVYYEMLSGTNPFQAPDAPSMMMRITTQDPPPLEKLRTDCLPGLEPIIQRMLKKNRDERYPSLEDAMFDLEPLVKELRKVQAQKWVNPARELIEGGDLEAADRLVRKILEYDPSVTEARAWREELRRKLRIKTIQPQLEKLLDQAESQLAQRQYPDAIRHLDSALRLDPGNSRVQARMGEIRVEFERVQRAQSMVSEARAGLEATDLSKAFALCSQAFTIDPQNREASRLLDQIKLKIEERDRQRTLQAALSRVRNMMLMQTHDEAVAAAREVVAQYPESEPARALLGEAEREQSRHHRERRKAEGIGEARKLLNLAKPEAAAARLEGLLREFGEDPLIRDLLRQAGDQIEKERKAAEIGDLQFQATALFEKQDFERTIGMLDAGLSLYGETPELRKLRDQAEAGRAKAQAAEQARLALRREVEEIRRLIGADQRELAEKRLAEAKRHHGGEGAVLLEATALFAARDFAATMQVLKAGVAQHGTKNDLVELMRETEEAQQQTQTREEISRALEAGRNAARESRFEQAQETLAQAARRWPKEASLVDLRREIDEKLTEVRNLHRQATALVASKDYDRAIGILDVALNRFRSRKDLEDLRAQARQAKGAEKSRSTSVAKPPAPSPPLPRLNLKLAVAGGGVLALALGIAFFTLRTNPGPTPIPRAVVQEQRPLGVEPTAVAPAPGPVSPAPAAIPEVPVQKKVETLPAGMAPKPAPPKVTVPEVPKSKPEPQKTAPPKATEAPVVAKVVTPTILEPKPEPVPACAPPKGDLGQSNQVTWNASGRALEPGETLVLGQGVKFGTMGTKLFPAEPFRVVQIDTVPPGAEVVRVAEPNEASCWASLVVRNKSSTPVQRIVVKWVRQ